MIKLAFSDGGIEVLELTTSIKSLCRTQRPSVERLGVLGRAPADTGYSRAETEASQERRGLSESALAEGSKAVDDANTDRDRCCRGGREFPSATGSPRRSVPSLVRLGRSSSIATINS